MTSTIDTVPTTVDVPIQDGYVTMQALRDFVEATDHYGEDAPVRVLPGALSIDVRP